MKQLLNTFGIQACIFLMFAGGTGVVYAAWDDAVSTGNSLTADSWNELIERTKLVQVIQNNYAIGANNFSAISSGDYNYAFGIGALLSIEDGVHNVGIGKSSMKYTTSGGYNTAVGGETMRYTNGDGNASLGYYALRGNREGSYNVAIGYQAGSNNDSSYNIAIGYQSGKNITSGDNNIMIGKNADAGDPSGDNQLNIGNSIYGDLADARIGIGVIDPVVSLDIVGELKVVDSAQICSAQIAGAIKFNSSLSKHQGCDGTVWQDLY